MHKKAYVLLAEGFELIEAMGPVDVLKRAGTEVVLVAVGTPTLEVESAQKVKVIANKKFDLDELKDADVLILPGGYPGYVNLKNNPSVVKLTSYYIEHGKYLAAICGAPSLLGENKLIPGKKFTCHTSVVDFMDRDLYEKTGVVVDGKLITSSGAGHAIEFGFAIANKFYDAEKLKAVKEGMELA